MIFIKSLDHGGYSIHNFQDGTGSAHYSQPKPDGQPGAWKPSCLRSRPNATLKPHFWGYHLAYADTVADWFHRENYIAEARGKIVEGETCVVAEEVRLVRSLNTTDKHWCDLATHFANAVCPLISALRFPQDFSKIIEGTFSATIDFLAGNSVNPKIIDYWKSCIMLVGRNEVDSQASHDWVDNSQAAKYAALAVASLALLRRTNDDARLVDASSRHTPLSRLANNPENGLGFLWSRGVRLLDADSDNFRVAKDVSGYAMKAAKHSMQQRICNGRGPLPLQAEWMKHVNPRLHRFAPNATQADKAASGLRCIQSQLVMDICAP